MWLLAPIIGGLATYVAVKQIGSSVDDVKAGIDTRIANVTKAVDTRIAQTTKKAETLTNEIKDSSKMITFGIVALIAVLLLTRRN